MTVAPRSSPWRRALRLGGLYVAVGALWILGSDSLLARLTHDPAQLTLLQTMKGWFFVFGTGVLLVLALRRLLQKDAATMQEFEHQRRRLAGLSQFRESVIDNASIWINVLDADARVTVWNQAAEAISGYPRDAVIGRADIWSQLYPDADYRARISAKVMAILDQGEEVSGYETTIRCRNGQRRIMSWNSRRFHDEHGAAGSIAIGLDVTERKRMQETLEKLAAQDPLTGLYNRRKLEAMADQSIRQEAPLALLWIDVDHFKRINDLLGHHAGDEVLRQLATLLRQHIRDQDCAARYGGDELVVALAGSDTARALELAERLQQCIAAADILADYREPITVSIGVASHPEHGSSVAAVSAAADMAMYQAKRAGRNRVCVAKAAAY
ncbi:MAG TPA: sensor domain-containing diguanylate cyclase [Rhodanobacteraceae bacterium]|nr:sensor domain-containing diguanylate cyclase [Rhodanobacteraceae bacterium]